MNYCPVCANKLNLKTIDNVLRKVCISPGCQFVHWNNPVPVIAALVHYNDEIILARNVKWPAAIFSLITGFLEKSETVEQAVSREVKEELGLDATALEFIGHYSFFDANQIILAFWVTAVGDLKIGDEIAEVRLLSRQDISHWNFADLTLTAAIVKDWLQQTATCRSC